MPHMIRWKQNINMRVLTTVRRAEMIYFCMFKIADIFHCIKINKKLLVFLKMFQLSRNACWAHLLCTWWLHYVAESKRFLTDFGTGLQIFCCAQCDIWFTWALSTEKWNLKSCFLVILTFQSSCSWVEKLFVPWNSTLVCYLVTSGKAHLLRHWQFISHSKD